MVDLRSDTVTRPSAGMRKAMGEAEVGDDVFGEDPTVLRLQDRVAELLGKDAALFVPSGVMGNQLGIKVLTQAGDEVILDRSSHIFNYETAASAVISGVQLHVIDGERGVLRGADVEKAIRPRNYWDARSRLVCLENTLNKSGGTVYPLDAIVDVAETARLHGLKLHLDGARLWNASAASGVPEREYAAPFDTVSVCLSKGLGAPVGSVLAGTVDSMTAARHYRKMLGGGMRQVGILAAAGLYALEFERPRLADDHAKARRLAEGIAEISAFEIDLESVQTNIVMFDVVDGDVSGILERLRDEGVLMVPFGPRTIRATTHRDVDMEQIDLALSSMRRLCGTTVAT